MKCRVCDREIDERDWRDHVMNHKREYCRVMGLSAQDAWGVFWEDVVRRFNPKNARDNKIVDYEKMNEKKRDKEQTGLESFGVKA